MSETQSTESEPWPHPVYAWYVVGVLMVALIFSFIDRTILALLVTPIRADLGLSDTQISLLMGIAFALFYVTCGIPIARLADRKSRRTIISIGITIWSLMTAFCGLANNFWQLFLGRLGVGVGESALTPSAYSIVSDYFPREKLPRALAVYHMGPPIGTGLSMIIGSFVVSMTEKLPHTLHYPIIGEIFSWQLTFFMVGLPGLLVVAVIWLTVKEPKRRGIKHDTAGTASDDQMSIAEVVKFMMLNWRTFGPHYIGLSLGGLLGYGTSIWMPTFFMRTYHWSVRQAGSYYGMLNVFLAPLGLIIGGYFATWLERKGYKDAYMRALFLVNLCLIPMTILFPLMPNAWMALGVVALRVFFGNMGSGPGAAVLQVITPNQMRAQVTAVYMMVLNLIAFGFGPVLVAAITDYVFGYDDALRYSMFLAAVVLGPISTGILWYGVRHYGDSVRRAEAWNETPATVQA